MTDNQNRVLYFGHSHTGAVFHALEGRRVNGIASAVTHVPYNIWRHDLNVHYVVDVGAGPIFNPMVVEEVGGFDLLGTRTICVAMFGGNPHNVLGLLETTPDYDFIFGLDKAEIDRSVMLLPFEMVHRQMMRSTQSFLAQLTALRAATKLPIFNLQSPGPIESNEYIRANLDRFFQREGQSVKIARAGLRRKLWMLHSDIVEKHCDGLGITTLHCPVGTLTEDSYLREKFWANATHANSLYGDLILSQVEELFS